LGVVRASNSLVRHATGGAEAIDTALKILARKPIEKKIVLGSRVFTAENVPAGGEALK